MGIARIRVFIALVFPRKSAPPDINYQMLHSGVRDKVLIESCCLRRGLREFVTSPCPGKFRKQNGGQRHEFLGFWLLLCVCQIELVYHEQTARESKQWTMSNFLGNL